MRNQNLFSEELQRVMASIGKGKNLPSVGRDGKYNPKSGVLYVAGKTTAIEQNSLVLPKNSEAVGVTNIDKARLKAPFVVTHMRAVFDNTTGAAVTAQTAQFKDDPSPSFANGELTVDQDGELIKIPVSAISNRYAATGVQDDLYPVSPFVIRDEKVFKITPDLAGAATANEVYRIELHGFFLQPDATV
jgi:hypothetical protein